MSDRGAVVRKLRPGDRLLVSAPGGDVVITSARGTAEVRVEAPREWPIGRPVTTGAPPAIPTGSSGEGPPPQETDR